MYFSTNILYCNTYQSSHGVLARIGTDFRGRVWISWYCPLHTGGIHANTSEYIPNLLMTGTKPVLVDGFGLVCIGMYWCLYWYVLCMYSSVLRPLNEHRFCPRNQCMYCMYWLVSACIGMYCACIMSAIQTSIQTNPNFDPNTNQIHLVGIMFVLCMYYVCIGMDWYVLVCICMD